MVSAPDSSVILSKPPAGARFVLSVLFGWVTRDGVPADLRKREMELIIAIARLRHGTTVQSVCGLLWPDEKLESARNTFRVNLARLRKALGEPNVISHRRELVAVAPTMAVDLWEIEDTLSAVRRLTGSTEQASRLEMLHQRLKDWQPESAPGWEWLAPTVRHIADIDHEVSERLAKLYLASGKYLDALALTDRMVERDPLDEPAHELRIQALIEQGERASAARELRLYGEKLRHELGIEPSESLVSLLGAKI